MTHPTKQSGFSLIELLVAALIFTFVVMGVSQLFSSALNIQRRASGFQRIQENALFVLESIARAVRVSAVTSGTDCGSGIDDADTLVIDHPVYGTVTYTYLKTTGGRGYLTRFAEDIGEEETITTEDIDVTKFAFCVIGAGPDDQQARITIPMTLRAVAAQPNAQVEVSTQTTIVSRDLIEELTN